MRCFVTGPVAGSGKPAIKDVQRMLGSIYRRGTAGFVLRPVDRAE